MSWEFKKDKKKHLFYGFLLSLLGMIFWPLYLTGFAAGVVKEVIDKYGSGCSEVADMVYTWAGAALSTGLGLILTYNLL